jgi:hypothetical protein
MKKMSEIKEIIINLLQSAFDTTLQQLADLERLLQLFGQDMSWYDENTTIQRYKTLGTKKEMSNSSLILYCQTRHAELYQTYQTNTRIVTPWQFQELFNNGVVEGKMLVLEEMMNRLQIPFQSFDELTKTRNNQ